MSIKLYRTTVRAGETRDAVHERGLSRSVVPDDCSHPLGRYLDGQTIQNLELAEPFREVAYSDHERIRRIAGALSTKNSGVSMGSNRSAVSSRWTNGLRSRIMAGVFFGTIIGESLDGREGTVTEPW